MFVGFSSRLHKLQIIFGRGASMVLIAKILRDLPKGLRRIHEKFGATETLDIFDKRDQFNVGTRRVSICL